MNEAENWEFTYDEFVANFPDLKTVTEEQFNFYVSLAQSYIEINAYFAKLPLERRQSLAQLVVAHLLVLGVIRGGNGAGAMTNASEGSVSVGFQGLNNANWWQSTQYGAMFWAIIRRYLSPVLVPGQTRYFGGPL